jgi:hypothetical protein
MCAPATRQQQAACSRPEGGYSQQMQSISRQAITATVGMAMLTGLAGAVGAASITVPNASFEAPPTTFATNVVQYWQEAPPQVSGDPSTYLTGVFSNVPPPIDNCDGGQGAFLFTYPQVSLFQDYDSVDSSSTTPSHSFGATYDVGKSYTLTVAVLGGTNLSIPMQEGTTLELGLYYRDSASNLIMVASTSITNNGALFPSGTHFVDFQVQVPTVKAGDAWAGQHIGIQMLSTVAPELAGGYWDLDNVRLVATVTPALAAPAYTNGHFSFTLQSEPGLLFEILASTNGTLPLSNWTSLGTLTNTNGATLFLDPATNLSRRFYRARQVLQ